MIKNQAAYREQAFDDISKYVSQLSTLQDGQGRNVNGFSAMRAVGRYVVHGVITEAEFSDLFRRAYESNGLYAELGAAEFRNTVKRALDGCQNDEPPKLKQNYARPPKLFDDSLLLRQGLKLTATYQFYDPQSQPVYQKLKYENPSSKCFLYRHQQSDGLWYQGRGPHPEYPYLLPEMLSNLSSPIVICEGEKDADTAQSLGLLSCSVSNWKDCAGYFRGRDVILVPDNDEAGLQKAERATQALQTVVRTIAIVALPDLPVKGDFTDWVEMGGTRKQFETLAQSAKQELQLTTQNGVPENTRANIITALSKMSLSLKYNELTDRIEVEETNTTRQLTEIDLSGLRLDLCEQYGFKLKKDLFLDLVTSVAYQKRYHPIKNYFTQLEWDKVPRVERFFIDIGGAKDSTLTRRISQIWFTAAVRRIYEPGVDFQELVVLESSQGQGKTTAIRKLCPDPGWFADDMPLNAPTKTIVEQTLGKWIIEAAELAGRQQDCNSLKRFLSTTTDRARLAYDRYARDIPRQWIAIGTTNETEYLIDSTGNRRFWPIKTGMFDLDTITPDYRDQLWAEAVTLHKQGTSIKLQPELWEQATQEQNKRFNGDPWEDILNRLLPEDDSTILVSSILEALLVPLEKQDRKASTRAAYIMRKQGFEKSTARHPNSKRVVKVWKRGEGGPIKKLTFSGTNII